MTTGEAVIPELPQAASASNRLVREYVEQETVWRPKYQKRFVELVRRKALDTITLREEVELEELQALRRVVHHPRSTKEIVFEYRRRQVTQELTQALTKFLTTFAS